MVVMAVLASDDSAGDGVVVGGLVRGGEGRVMLVHRIVVEH